jgi:TPR repeat protein
MYAHGRGVPQDEQATVRWYRKAAEQGHAKAQCNLGAMYVGGRGVTQDYVRAHMWFNIAGANGEKVGREKRSIVEKLMTPTHIAEAQKLAREWMQKHQR